MSKPTSALILAAGGILLSALPASALSIVLEYPGASFFGSHESTAKSAISKAADDLEAAITTTLGAVPVATFTGTSGATSFTLNYSYTYTDPNTGTTGLTYDPDVSGQSLTSDVVKIFVGTRNLTGTTLGMGGAGGLSTSTSFGGFASGLTAAVSAGDSSAEATMTRGGPVFFTTSGSATIGATTAPYSVDIGLGVGHLWFDSDTDNNSVADDDTTLGANWHFDHTTSVASGKDDLYSVALHEIMHVLGIGSSPTWTALAAGTFWGGSAAQSLNGASGSGLVDSGGSHIGSSVLSTRLSDSGSQAPAMTPSITSGTRKSLTYMDVAFLQDIGWATVAIPEPSALAWLGLAWLAFQRRKPRG